MIKTILLSCFFFLLLNQSGIAQVEAEHAGENNIATNTIIKTNSIYGEIIDTSTGRPIEAASVQLYPADKKKAINLLSGMLSKANGEFRFQNLPLQNTFRLVVTALGYKDQDKIIYIDVVNANTDSSYFEKNLGKISMDNNVKKNG